MIKPDQHNDWIGQRGDKFIGLYPIGSKSTKSGKVEDAIFGLFSNGYKTGKDEFTYNFSNIKCAQNAQSMVMSYQSALRDYQASINYPQQSVDHIVRRYSSNVKWDHELKDNLRKIKKVAYSSRNIIKAQYRPFIKQHCYIEYLLASRKYRIDEIFPTATSSKNCAICVSGIGSLKPFSALIVDTIPDLEVVSKGQCFPRYRYCPVENAKDELFEVEPKLKRIDNITHTAWWNFRRCYIDISITKDDIFYYVYGILNAPSYCQQFSIGLTKEIPRIPLAPDFRAFCNAGHELAKLHLEYENCKKFPLEVEYSQLGPPRPEHFRIGRRAMRFEDKAKTILRINEFLSLHGIPPSAHRYQVNGRTPLEWFIDRYRLSPPKENGIVNDPNDWFKDPRDLIAAIQRIVWISVETTRIIEAMPEVPDTNFDNYKPIWDIENAARRGSRTIASDPSDEEDQAFIDSITDWSAS